MGYQIGSYFKSKYTGIQIENALDTFGNMAAPYDPATTYSAGTVVLYNNALYVCTGTTTGTWDPSKWTQIDIASLASTAGGAAGASAGSAAASAIIAQAVQTVPQTFTTDERNQARQNIFAAARIEKDAANDPDNSVFDIAIDDAEEGYISKTLIKGKTVARNQLVQNGNFADGTNNWTRNGSGTFTVSGGVATFTSGQQGGNIASDTIQTINGHKYIIRCEMKLTTAPANVVFRFSNDTSVSVAPQSNTNWQELAVIGTATTTNRVQITDGRASGWDAIQVRNVNCIDLTAEGYTSAETTDVATFKAAFLKRMGFPLPQYIPYDAGSLKNVDGEYRLRGRNLWDEVWRNGWYSNVNGTFSPDSRFIANTNPIPVNPSETYYIKTPNTYFEVWGYDENMNFVGAISQYVQNSSITIPENVRYINFNSKSASAVTSYSNDITINESDPTFNGTYEPYYNGGTIDLSTDPLNGVGTAVDEEDVEKGTRTDETVVFDLGDRTWTADNGIMYSESLPNLELIANNSVTANILCGRYVTIAYTPLITKQTDKVIALNNSRRLYVYDSAYSDAATFKAAMAGVKLVAKLATPVTRTITPQPLETQYGYNVLEPVSGGVQSASVEIKYGMSIKDYIDSLIGA